MITEKDVDEIVEKIDDVAYWRAKQHCDGDVQQARDELKKLFMRLFVEKEDHG